MGNYRPITDMWMLARPGLLPHDDGTKRKYYGAYLGGFPERARALLAARYDEPVLHVCGGAAKHYKYVQGFGPNDKTLDMDPATAPDFLQDAREPWPASAPVLCSKSDGMQWVTLVQWAAILIDPPYTETDAEKYAPGAKAYPSPGVLLQRAFEVLPDYGRVGIIHYLVPRAPSPSRFVACVGVMAGFNNRMRAYTVYEKLPQNPVGDSGSAE